MTYLDEFRRRDLPRLLTEEQRREDTFGLALELWKPDAGIIVETGTFRSWAAGAGTVVLGRAAALAGSKLLSLDSDQTRLAAARLELQREGLPDVVGMVLGDSVASLEALAKGGERIGLLYLDSMEVESRLAYQTHSMREFLVALPMLGPDSVVLLDDDTVGWEGKPYLTRRYMQEHGWVCRLHHYQSVWTRRAL